MLVPAGRKRIRCVLRDHINFRHGQTGSYGQIPYYFMNLWHRLWIELGCAIHPREDFVVEPVADTVRNQRKK